MAKVTLLKWRVFEINPVISQVGQKFKWTGPYERGDQITHKNRKIRVNLRQIAWGARFKVCELKYVGIDLSRLTSYF